MARQWVAHSMESQSIEWTSWLATAHTVVTSIQRDAEKIDRNSYYRYQTRKQPKASVEGDSGGTYAAVVSAV